VISVKSTLQTQTCFSKSISLLSPHSVQALSLVDPAGEVGVFVSQSVHGVLPSVFLYLPSGHFKQLPAAPENPMLHRQAFFSLFGVEPVAHGVQAPALKDPINEIESVLQLVHTAFPGAVLYVPAAHCKQLPDSKVCPMLHTQAVFVVSGAEFTRH